MATKLFWRSVTMKNILFLICALGAPVALLAQSSQGSWANLGGLQPGQKIQVAEMTSKKHSGTFVSFSDAAISYQDTAGEKTIQKQDVRSVKLMENKHRLRNTLIGLGVGTGAGAGIGAATHKSCTTQTFCLDIGGKAIPAAIGAVIGGLGGAAVGFLLPAHSTIYSVPSH